MDCDQQIAFEDIPSEPCQQDSMTTGPSIRNSYESIHPLQTLEREEEPFGAVETCESQEKDINQSASNEWRRPFDRLLGTAPGTLNRSDAPFSDIPEYQHATALTERLDMFGPLIVETSEDEFNAFTRRQGIRDHTKVFDALYGIDSE